MEAGLFSVWNNGKSNGYKSKYTTRRAINRTSMHMSIIMKVEVSFNSGVSCCLLDGKRGMINAQQVAGAINDPEFYNSPLTSLVCVENTTTNKGLCLLQKIYKDKRSLRR
jgi:hypothetical protein